MLLLWQLPPAGRLFVVYPVHRDNNSHSFHSRHLPYLLKAPRATRFFAPLDNVPVSIASRRSRLLFWVGVIFSTLIVVLSPPLAAHHEDGAYHSDPLQSEQSAGTLQSGAGAQSEFTFARLVYEGINSWSDWPRWQADWPEAEWHFSRALDRLTRIDTHQEGVLIRLDDDSVFDYPWLYAVEVGSLQLSSRELQTLREYLLRGGFLMVDDFHGIEQWRQFEHVMQRVFPDRAIEEPVNGVGIYSVLFDIGETQQIPGIRPWLSNRTWEYGGTVPRWRVIRDDDGRVMVVINFNMDLGDAWEHADDARYPQSYSSLAYRIGTNYVLYSMTH